VNAQVLLETARAYERLAEIYFLASETLRTMHATLRTLNLAERAGPSPELARGYGNVCIAVGLAPLHGPARAYARRAHAIAAQLDDPPARAWALMVTAIYTAGAARWTEACAWLEESIAICERLGDRRVLGRCWHLRSGVRSPGRLTSWRSSRKAATAQRIADAVTESGDGGLEVAPRFETWKRRGRATRG
jgi:hypothetical protein